MHIKGVQICKTLDELLKRKKETFVLAECPGIVFHVLDSLLHFSERCLGEEVVDSL